MASLSLNVENFITLKLTPTNYPLWHEQVLSLAESQKLVGHLTDEDPTRSKFTTFVPSNTDAKSSTPKLTTKFIAWRKSDHFLCGWIIRTIWRSSWTRLNIARSIWDALKNAYAQDSKEREFTLLQQVTYLPKDDDRTMGEHIHHLKGLCDSFATIKNLSLTKKFFFSFLTSLSPQYETFTTTMLKPPRPSSSELVLQLQSRD